MKILYLEDNPQDAILTVHTLRRSAPDIEVEVVNLLQEAMTRIGQEPRPDYDLILTDLNLPDGSGLEFLAHIRSAELPYGVVVVTGQSDQETIISALKAGADDYIIKSLDYLQRLPATLENALSHHQAEAFRHSRPIHVLYADRDAVDIRQTTAYIHAHATHIHLDTVDGPAAFFDRLRSKPGQYDVLLLEYDLPGMTAIEVLKDIVEKERLNLPVVIFTRQSSEEIVLQATRLGATDFLTKDAGYLVRLPAVIENAFHRAQMLREQAALSDAEAKYRALVEQVPAAIYSDEVDELSTTLYMSPYIQEITGYSAEEWMDKPDTWFRLIHPDDLEMARRENQRSNAGEDGLFRLEYRMIAADGRVVWVRDEAVRLGGKGGQPPYWQGILVDITEEKEAEAILRRRDAIMEAVAMAAELFLKAPWQENILTILERLGTATEASRAYIFKNHRSSNGCILSDQIFEWTRDGISAQIDSPELHGIDLAASGFENWVTVMSAGLPLRGLVREMPAEERSLLEAQAIKSLICMPVFVGGAWWGFFGFDDCQRERDWPTIEIEALRAAASILGAAIRRLEAEETTQRRLIELGILRDVAILGTAAADLDELVTGVTRILGDLLYPDNLGILLVGPDEALRPHPSYRGIQPESLQLAVPSGQGVCGTVLASGLPLRLSDVTLVEGYISVTAGIRSELCVPLTASGKHIGVINVESRQLNFFTEDDERLLVTVAGTLTTAIERIRLFEQERLRRQEAETLREAASLISGSLELSVVLGTILQSVQRVVPFDRSTIFLFSEEQDRFILVASKRPGGERWESGERQHRPNSLVDEIRLNKRPVILHDALADARFEPWDNVTNVRAWMGIPLITHGDVIGFLTLDHHLPGAYDAASAALVQTFAFHASAAIENAQLYQETRRRLEELEAINRISKRMRGAQSPEEVLPGILDEILDVLRLQDGAIWLHEPRQNTVKQVASKGWFRDVRHARRRSGEGLAGYIFARGENYLIEDFQNDEHISGDNRTVIPPNQKGAGIPIRTTSETIGILFVAGDSTSTFSRESIRLLTTLAEIIGNAIHRATLFAETEKQVMRLTALRDVDSAISSSFELGIIYNILLDHAMNELRVDAADILVLSPQTQLLTSVSRRGFRNGGGKQEIGLIGSLPGQAVLERRALTVANLAESDLAYPEVEGEGFVFYSCQPLIAKRQVKGILEVFRRSPFTPQPDWLEFLDALTGQAAIALENSSLFNNLQRSNMELAMAYDITLERWGQAMEMRAGETPGHTLRVADLAVQLALEIGVDNDEEIAHLRRGALLHDIGRMALPDEMVGMPEALSPAQQELLHRHPLVAYELLHPITFLRPALDIPYCHYERWDGSGYPRGLRGSEIPKAARIFAVVDAWDTLLSDRPSRPGWARDEVMRYLRAQAGVLFDPEVVRTFLQMVEENRLA